MLNLVKVQIFCPECGERFEFETIDRLEGFEGILCPECLMKAPGEKRMQRERERADVVEQVDTPG